MQGINRGNVIYRRAFMDYKAFVRSNAALCAAGSVISAVMTAVSLFRTSLNGTACVIPLAAGTALSSFRTCYLTLTGDIDSDELEEAKNGDKASRTLYIAAFISACVTLVLQVVKMINTHGGKRKEEE